MSVLSSDDQKRKMKLNGRKRKGNDFSAIAVLADQGDQMRR
jgi:hypothetical protein